MCGFSGFFDPGRTLDAETARASAARAAAALTHRGPDDSGVWIDPEAGIGLGHRRLSIIDPSAHGHQPMFSGSGRYVVAYNGELYNFPEVRAELLRRGHSFAGHSDTEVLLAAIEEWGLDGALERFVGMFAFALWDRTERRLHLARDRMGEKPLYFGWSRGVFLFGSELKALRTHPAWEGLIDTGALALFLRFGYVAAPWSIYKGIGKLTPGCTVTIGSAADTDPRHEPYWSPRELAEVGAREPYGGSAAEAADELEALLSRAVRQQMIADVPLGAFLSGGVDSSTVVALMQAQSAQPVRTFTIGFHEPGYNEAEHAKAVARHLGTDHTELYVTPREAMDVIPLLPRMYDEPFADSSQIPTYLVSQLARRHVTVSLSGDGGDELFGGYVRYMLGPWIWRRIRHMPRPVRAAAGTALEAVGAARWNSLATSADRIFGPGTAPTRLGERLGRLSAVLRSGGSDAIYDTLVSGTTEPASLLRDDADPAAGGWQARRDVRLSEFAQRMMYFDALAYLPDDILVKVDRASMACSLESRAPFLDHRVVEFAWRLPLRLKIRGGSGKWILRQVLYRHVPRALIERPKAGFAIPVGSWLRGPLRDWGESLLGPEQLRAEGFFNPASVRRLWDEHQAGRHDRQFVLWALLMFQDWLASDRVLPEYV